MIDQAFIDRATELINGGMLYQDVAKELGVKPCTVSGWRMRGLIPPTPFKPTAKQAPVENQKKRTSNHGKVRHHEPLPALTASQRLDGSPIIAAPAPAIEEKHEEKEEKEPMTFEGVAEAPVVEPVPVDTKPRIERSVRLDGTYLTVKLTNDKVAAVFKDQAIKDALANGLTKRELVALMMDISDELEAMINLPEMVL